MVYCTASELKEYSKVGYKDLGYASEDAYTTFLMSLISDAQGVVDGFCNVPAGLFAAGGIDFASQLYTIITTRGSASAIIQPSESRKSSTTRKATAKHQAGLY